MTEATWMYVDVAPDGTTLVFDLLGDLYALPITGGAARPLTSGREWDRAPRFSPDGRSLAFVSDRGGSDGLWVMPAAGGPPRRIYGGDATSSWEAVTGTPGWTADGNGVAVGFQGPVSVAVVIDSRTGETSWPLGEPLKEVSNRARRTGDGRVVNVKATSLDFTPDGRSAYFSETRSETQFDDRVQPRGRSLQVTVVHVDLTTSARTHLTQDGQRSDEFKPQLSRSGRLLAYLRRDPSGETELRVRHLVTNEDRRLCAITDADEPYRWVAEGDERPAYAFTPDDRHVVITFGGKIHRIAVADGADAIVPFKVDVAREVASTARPSFRLEDGELPVRAVRWPTLSRDGRTLVFSAVGFVWVSDLRGTASRRLTDSDHFEYMPAVSPDGASVAFVDFEHDRQGTSPGRLMVAPLAGGSPRRIASDDATYLNPSWSPDGSRLAFIRETSGEETAKAAFGWVDLRDGIPHVVAEAPSGLAAGSAESYSRLVSFTSDGQRLLFSWAPDERSVIVAEARLDGSEFREVARAGPDVRGILPSPDLSHVALIGWDEDAWVAALSPDLGPARLTILDAQAKRVSRSGAAFPIWHDAQTLIYGFANRIYRYRLGEPEGQMVSHLSLRLPRRVNSSALAFVNARLVTVTGERGAGRVFERGTVVVRGRRISAIGPADRVPVPTDAKTFDATGLTIVPGFVDVHYHRIGAEAGSGTASYNANKLPHRWLSDESALAFGVTTAWDPGGVRGDGSMAVAELREAGRIVGPRWAISVWPVGRPFAMLTSEEKARTAVARRRDLGATVLKEYSTPGRPQRQWLHEAAHRERLGIVSHVEGLDNLLTRATDGYTGGDHPFVVTPWYADVRELLVRTGFTWTPNLIITDGVSGTSQDTIRAFLAEVRQIPGQWAKVQRYTRPDRLEAWKGTPPQQFNRLRVARVARAAAELIRAGGKVAISSHNMPAVLTHGEIWFLQRGGATPGEALRAATMTGAEKIGLQHDIGSLEPGKAADFLVLTADPLEDIRNTLALKYTVADGIVYESDTLRVVWAPETSLSRLAADSSQQRFRTTH